MRMPNKTAYSASGSSPFFQRGFFPVHCDEFDKNANSPRDEWIHISARSFVWRQSEIAFFVRQLRLSHFCFFGKTDLPSAMCIAVKILTSFQKGTKMENKENKTYESPTAEQIVLQSESVLQSSNEGAWMPLNVTIPDNSSVE